MSFLKNLRSFEAWLATTLGAFFRNVTGAAAITYALAGPLLVGLAFAGIDLSRVAVARNQLQDALDSATLAAGGTRSNNPQTITDMGRKYMSAALSGDQGLLNLNSTFSISGSAVVGKASADLEPIIIGLFTGDNLHVTANAEVVRGQDQIVELALVLDTTGSMSGTKIATLRTAAKGLVTSLFNASEADEVKIGLVPFAQHVNMGVASRSAPWADVPADVHILHPSSYTPACTTTQCDTTQVACQVPDYGMGTCTGYNDGVSYSYSCRVQTGSHSGFCTQQTNCRSVPLRTCPGPVDNSWWENSTFYGCYGSPAYPDNVRDDNANRRYPGIMNITCSAPAIPLTTNSAALLTAINSLTASGETYIPAGLAWGFNMLSPAAPLTEGLPYDTAGPNLHPRKIMVLMTDGANTKQMNHGSGQRGVHNISASPALEADAYTRELCNNIKSKGIEVFTVAFEITGNASAKNLVKSCATDADHFFDATNQSALLDAFEQIAQSIQSLRIAH